MSYWDALAIARARLRAGDLTGAEAAFAAALDERERSPGRVFLSETVSDAARRFWARTRRDEADAQAPGRWPAAAAAFRVDFRARAEVTMAEALRRCDGVGEGADAGAVDLLATGLRLVTSSRLYPFDAVAGARLLRAIVGFARRAGRPLDPTLIRADLPLAEEDRLALAAEAEAWLDGLVAAAAVTAPERVALARAVLRLIDPVAFSAGGRFHAQRAWREALLTDRHAGAAVDAIPLYRACLAMPDESGAHADAARVRLVELLANIDAQHLPVPRHDEAVALLGGAPPAEPVTARRYAVARRALARRRPPEATEAPWASLSMSPDGLCAVVWWGGQPCDVAFWQPGDDPEPLRRFLRPCRGRLVRRQRARSGLWAESGAELAGEPVEPFAEALLEPTLPSGGLTAAAAADLARDRAMAWREGWEPQAGHPLLAPPAPGAWPPVPEPSSAGVEELTAALEAGLLWLACLARLRALDPRAAAGVRRLGARGDRAAALAALFLPRPDVGGSPDDVGARGWAPPPLAERPDPVLPAATPTADAALPLPAAPALVLATTQPAAALRAWGGLTPAWRVVLDGDARLAELAAAAHGRVGLTLIPPGGRVHALRAALAWLDAQAGAGAGADREAEPDLLPLFHWLRVAECHNGDLGDYATLRPRLAGTVPVADRHAVLAASLPRLAPGDSTDDDPWASEYAERVRNSRVVAGPPSLLSVAAPRLDILWGVREGGDAAWVFFDSARIHWQLLRAAGVDPVALHERLARRGGRHLSLLRGGSFLRAELGALLAEWLAPFGAVASAAEGDEGAPSLVLACAGVAPDARALVAEAGAAAMEHVARLASEGQRPVVLLPAEGPAAALWGAFAAGRLRAVDADGIVTCIEAGEFWSEERLPAPVAGARLVVPVLTSLASAALAPPEADTPAAWALADRRRAEALARERRLCSLEVNALLAGGAAVVDVADPRWRRRFPLPGAGAGDAGDEVARAGGPRAQGYDLPLLDEVPAGGGRGLLRRRRPAESRRLDVIVAWLRAHEGREGRAAPAAPLGDAVTRGTGVRLLEDDGETAWAEWARALTVARERGESAAWLLVAGPRPPAGAGLLAATFPTAASTTWGPDQALAAGAPGPGPLLWVAPEVLADPRLQAIITAHPPLVALVTGLDAWLPRGVRGRLAAAAALRFFARGLPRVDIGVGGLPIAWRAVLTGFLAEGTGSTVAAPTATAMVGEIRVAADAEAACPDCAAAVPLVGARPACPACGLDLDTWQDEAARRQRRCAVLRARLKALDETSPAGGGDFALYASPEDYRLAGIVLTNLGRAVEEAPEGLRSRGPSGDWTLVAPGREPPRGAPGRPVLLGPGGGLLPAAGALEGHSSVVCMHPDDLGAQAQPVATERVVRAIGLVMTAARVERPAWARSCRGVLPPAVVRALTGLPAAQVAEGLTALAWLTVLETGTAGPGTGPVAPPRRALRPTLPLSELEYRVRRSAELAGTWLPAWLEGAPPGLLVICDLAAAVGGGDEEEIAWLDRLLTSFSLKLRGHAAARTDGDMFRGFTGAEQLLWRAPEGTLFSGRRVVGTLGQPRAVAERLAHEAERFLAQARDLLASTVTDESGARVELGPAASSFDAIVETGCLLGAWWIEGEARPAELDLAAHAWLADAPAAARERAVVLARDQDAARDRLLAALGDGGEPVVAAATTAARGRRDAPAPARAVALAAPPDEGAVRRVAALLGASGPARLVLRGPAGAGRLAAITAGLAEAVRAGRVRPDAVAVWCPTPGVAARVHLAWRRGVDGARAPALFVAPGGAPPPGSGPPPGRHLPFDAGAETAILVEAEALPLELRFAVQQRYRQGRLLAIVDPAAGEEPWEHLFVTTPRDAEICDCPDQRAQTRRVWEETRRFAAGADGRPARGRALRRERGEAAAHGAASLDECVALLLAEEASGRLGRRSAVVAAARDDLFYLGRTLAGRGWLPVVRWELDALLLPGALEFVALASDVAAAAGEADAARAPLLPPLLDPVARAAYHRWLAAAAPVAQAPLSELYARVSRTGWAASWLERPEARRRVERLVRDAGAESPARFVKRPLWAAWRLELADWLDAPAATPRAPLVTLATPETCGATGADTLVYLCLGDEARQRHYRVFARATERVLVFYQEISPLSGEEIAAD